MPKKIIKCYVCEGEFERWTCYIKEKNFCSRSCQGKWQSKERIGENASNWKGGEIEQNGGYIHQCVGNQLHRAKHRIVMENHLCRKLTSDEIVHHINHNKKDNRIENLEVVTRAEHCRIHKPMKKLDNGAKEI